MKLRIPRALTDWSLAVIQQMLDANCMENGLFDWKERFPDRRDETGKSRLVRAATAMANVGGGFIVFGVADKGATTDRIVGVDMDQEFGREVSQQLHRADPPVPHDVSNPPIHLPNGKAVYVVEIIASAAPHSDADGRYFARTGGGTDQPITTHQLRRLFRNDDVLEAPGLAEIQKLAFIFVRGADWERVRAGLDTLASYAAEGTPNQRVALLEALARLAIYTRQDMPNGIVTTLLALAEEATLDARTCSAEAFQRSLELATDIAGHVGYDAALYLRHGFAVHTTARLLSQLLHRANESRHSHLTKLVLDQFDMCIDAAKRSQPEPWTDAVRWYEHKRAHPGRGRQTPPPELDHIEARLLGIRA